MQIEKNIIQLIDEQYAIIVDYTIDENIGYKHFKKIANDDVLHELAEIVYANRFRKRS